MPDTAYSEQDTNVYMINYECFIEFCYTSNVTLAQSWPACLLSQLQAKFPQKLNHTNSSQINNYSDTRTWSGCEYIDYSRLQGGVRSPSSGATGSFSGSPWSWRATLGTAALTAIHFVLYL